ncbi:ImuA family protein [Paracoccus methylarcula]|uniref:Inducible mutagenesis protein A n=1 Tax=Paracoccus methylarcula TaxID=72022 RepID=A0A422QYG5_9RHOB|nr:inducible mutagenesis protein A [Paracoccus methylarcula]RNF35038.1 inducible mutagenesis protein A [Paracoccus methylarcula]
MSSPQNIDALRQRIASRECLSPIRRPVLSLGPDRLDAAFADNGLSTGALHEIVPTASGDLAAGIGFGACLLTRIACLRPGFVLWALPADRGRRGGAAYPLGLTALGLDPAHLIQVEACKGTDILWTLEEGLGHPALSAVIGVLPERDRSYDFTASRRLAMRAARQGVTALILRGKTHPAMSTAAETRWSVGAMPNAPAQHAGPVGAPRWRIELTKCRKGTPGQWEVEWDHETLSFRFPAPLADRAPAWAHGTYGSGWAKAS